MNTKEIKRATIGRLPQYLRYISSLPQEITTVSATGIAKALDLGEVQVRKDLGAVCGAGRPRVGYDRAELTTCLEDCLGGRPVAAVIVGAGKLGRVFYYNFHATQVFQFAANLFVHRFLVFIIFKPQYFCCVKNFIFFFQHSGFSK